MKIELLRNKIFKMFEGSDQTPGNYTVKEWFKFAENFWTFT